MVVNTRVGSIIPRTDGVLPAGICDVTAAPVKNKTRRLLVSQNAALANVPMPLFYSHVFLQVNIILSPVIIMFNSFFPALCSTFIHNITTCESRQTCQVYRFGNIITAFSSCFIQYHDLSLSSQNLPPNHNSKVNKIMYLFRIHMY